MNRVSPVSKQVSALRPANQAFAASLSPALVRAAAQARREREKRTSFLMGLAVAASAIMHAVTILLFLPHPGGAGLAGQIPPIEVELVQVSATGAQPTQAAAPASPAPPTEEPPSGTEPAPPPAAPVQSRPAAPAVHLGDGGSSDADMNVTSDDVVPPRLDSAFRNLAPAYPAEAIRQHQTGTVHLLIHVGIAGVPDLVEVAGSSGHPSLDQAALTAIERWRFRPAQGEAGPVPYSVPIDIHFVGDGR